METIDILINIRRAIATSSVPFTDEEYDTMYDLLDELENTTPKRDSDDWRGCQGTCDFEESFNTTGWI